MLKKPDPVMDRASAAFQARVAALEAAPMGLTRLTVVLLCFVLNLLDGVDVVLLTYAAPVIAQEWGLKDGALGIVLTASLLGTAFGSMLMGPLADMIGRRKVVLIAISLIGTGMLLAATTHDMLMLAIWRVVTGVGIGAILASMASITSEFSNAKLRSFWVAFLQAGWPIGAIITGFASAVLIQAYGWKPLFFGSGLLSVFILPLVAWLMPESLQFLAKQAAPDRLERMNQLLVKLGQPPLAAAPPLPEKRGVKLSALFEGHLARSTPALWLGMTMGWAGLYFLISWIPRIAVNAGLALDQAIMAGATFNIGAFIGSAGIGLLATRLPLNRLIPVFLGSATLLMLLFGWVSMPIAATFATILGLGVLVQGGFNAFYPTAAQLYPTEIRTTGIGTAMAVGRSGAILGPLAAGYLMEIGTDRGLLFLIYAVPLAIAAAAAWRVSSRPA
ncbi:MFS transporter [Niveispirillum sp. SYP-B3756]|uniref:MFS transporter n=1 Tax=Niveispirillum sp. SYP-B3756 TaxID=2662178 RepID=UPI0012929423|nr:MFS transporter [Niveispirillum sp. SYP-B3756]MQP64938.1 MFS transporter [Niveispirillum sp. SYP-B3756]